MILHTSLDTVAQWKRKRKENLDIIDKHISTKFDFK